MKARFAKLALIVLMMLALCVNTPAADEKEKVGLNEIYSAMQLLREDYVKELDQYKLLNGALDGIKGYLKKKKLDSREMDIKIDPEKSIEANMRNFSSAYGKVLMYNDSRLKEGEMVYHALKGMMGVIQKSFNDPYTVAMDPEEFRMLEEQLNSRDFSGIGVFLDLDKKKENALIVVEPIEGSPAEAAGLKSGDIILRINGVSTKGMNIDSASSRIRGPAKTPVLLHIKRGTRVPFDVKIVRDVVHVSSVAQKMIGDVGYVKLRFFGETTGEEFEKALDEVDRKGARAVIIDLRNNGGGYVMAAVQVSSEFLSKDVLITSVVNYRKDSRDIHKAFEPHFKAKPLVLIVNRYSASASEIFAGCIQDHKAGTIVGEKTFGKGSVQTIHRLPGGGAIKLTTAHYLTPSGKDINKVGINPDVAVSMDPSLIDSKRDAQLEKALGALKK